MIEISQDKIIKSGYKLLIPEKKIHERMVAIGQEISQIYHNEIPILIGVLNGGFIFLADLIRYINIDCEIDFIRISSYGDATETSGHIKVLKPLSADIKGRHVVIVEDIIDSGYSLEFLVKMLTAFGPASLRIVTLLQKRSCLKAEVNVDFVGFDIEDKFVIGYGLDYQQIKRNLRSIYIVDN
jgi:hypoxanthine phosphoribosyltransferase